MSVGWISISVIGWLFLNVLPDDWLVSYMFGFIGSLLAGSVNDLLDDQFVSSQLDGRTDFLVRLGERVNN